MILPERTRHGFLLASMSVQEGNKPNNVLSAFPGILSRAWSVGGTEDLSALQAPWLQAGRFLREGINGGFQSGVMSWLYKGTGHAKSSNQGRRLHGGRGDPSQVAKNAWLEGVSYERKLDLVAAIAALSKAVDLHPDDAAYVSRLSKQWSDISYIDGTSHQDARKANTKALELAQQAVELDSSEVLAHIAVCVSKGRLACFSDNRTKIQLAKEAEDAAKLALQIDSKNDLAHHLMGRWHYEMAGLNPLARVFVRVVYGTALSPGSYHGALDEFVTASSLAPHRVIHKIQLGKAHWKLGNRAEAIEHLETAMDMEIEDLNDFLERREGERILNRLKAVKSSRWQTRTPARSGALVFASMSFP